MSMNHDEYIDLSVDNIDDTEDIEFDTYNDEIRINPVLKTHLDDGDKLVWYKDPTIIATWHSNGRLDVPCFDATDVTISAVNFRILKGHWRTKDEHGVGTESNHWLYDDKPISEYLDLYPDFWKANEIKAVQPKKERKPRQKKETSDKTVNVILPRQEDIVKEYKYKSEKYLYDSNYSDTYPDKLRKQATPSWVAENMIDLLPDEVWRTNSKFLNIYCKSGIFLEIIIDRLMKKVDYSSIGLTSDREIRQYIIENQVYAICWNKWYLDLSRKAINGKSSMVGNIYCIGPKIENMTEEEAKKVLENDKEQSSIDKTLLGIDIRKEFFKDMQFDVVVGNPPYNNDIYIPFVEMGHQIATNCSLFITPAKWQAKGGEKNENFRKNIVPYMSKIVIEHNCKEVFDIQETSGISYYLIDKNKHDEKLIKNKCRVNSTLDKNWEVHHDYRLWTSEINNIIDKCIKGSNSVKDKLNYKRFEFTAEQERGNSKQTSDSDIAVMQGQNIVGYLPKSELFTTDNLEKYKVTSLILISMQVIFGNSTKILGSQNYNILQPNQVPKGSFPVLMYFNTEKECKSFVSYFNSKLMSFLFFVGVCGGTLTSEFYRFVPDPVTFDKIYVDSPDPKKQPNAKPDEDGNYEYNGQKYCSLYKKYNLTPDEINIIESVIKERK